MRASRPPKAAIARVSDYLVIGRLIVAAADPAARAGAADCPGDGSGQARGLTSFLASRPRLTYVIPDMKTVLRSAP